MQKGLSKFKNVFGEKKKETFEDVFPADITTEGNLIAINTHFLACSWKASGGGLVHVFDCTNPVRIPEEKFFIRGHTAPVCDVKFSPFQTNLLATCSDDATVKIWTLPKNGLTEDIHDETQKYSGHSKKVLSCSWNPAVHEIIASGSFDCSAHVWNITNGAVITQFNLPDVIQSLEWNLNGTLLGATCKDKTVNVLDPRMGAEEAKRCISAPSFEGNKTQKMVWLDHDHLAVTGFSKANNREIRLFDTRKFEKEIQTLKIDSSGGVISPYFDEDTNMLYTPARGEGSVKYFEFSDNQVKYLDQYSSTNPQKSFCFFPKRTMNIHKSEVARMVKLAATTVEYISFRVPKRVDGFSAELYPECLNGQPGMTLEEWNNKGETGALRSPIDKLENSFNVQETVFEKKVDEVVFSPDVLINQLKDENHILQQENHRLHESLKTTEDRLDAVMAELEGLKTQSA